MRTNHASTGLRRRLAVIATAGVLVFSVAACGGGGGSDAGKGSAAPAAAGTLPKASGTRSGTQTMRFVTNQSPITSLDPAYETQSPGSAYVNVFGTLARYDHKAKEVVPWMADSFSANGDHTVWTVKLRDGVKFTDGTPYDAAAVVKNIERHLDPKVGARSPVGRFVSGVKETDPLTVEFTLIKGWVQFPYLLSEGAGVIAAPSYLDKLDAGDSEALPVGAGPFAVKKFTPGSSVQAVANKEFFDGAPSLETVTFEGNGDTDSVVDAMGTGSVDGVIFGGVATALNRLRNEAKPGFEWIGAQASMVVYNVREGNVTAEFPVLREALNLATDHDLINQVYSQDAFDAGKTLASKKSSLWAGMSEYAQDTDVAKAKKLIDQAKAEGFDGKVDLLTVDVAEDAGVAVKSAWEKAGLTVNLEVVDMASFLDRYAVNRNFETVLTSLYVTPLAPWRSMYFMLDSDTPNVFGLQEPEFDSAVEDLRTAATEDEVSAAFGGIQKLWTANPPAAIWSTLPSVYYQANDQIRGVVPSGTNQILLDKAFRVAN